MLLLTGCVIIFTLLFTPIYLSWFYKKAVRKFLLDPNNKDVLAKTQLIINDACINEITPSSEVKYKWDAFKNKVENKEYLYLYIHANYALVIPKRILNENEKVQLKFFLSRNLPLTSEFSIK
jgi:hypothetical protein